jgi:hypothetical protein
MSITYELFIAHLFWNYCNDQYMSIIVMQYVSWQTVIQDETL